eukprot:m.200095 g.200095  ORF g.200095 m.200095 type:complete len:176 (+) comp39585_c0_seq6:1068-1595(+)
MLMGRRLRTRLPTLPNQLKPKVPEHEEVKLKDTKSKNRQAGYYNRRHGVRELAELKPGDDVLIWDSVTRMWKIPGRVWKQLGPRTYAVKLASGRKLRRNRHQIQYRKQREDLEDDWNMQDDVEYNASTDDGIESIEGDSVETPGESLEIAETPGQVVTRSGRAIQLPAWRQDCVT